MLVCFFGGSGSRYLHEKHAVQPGSPPRDRHPSRFPPFLGFWGRGKIGGVAEAAEAAEAASQPTVTSV